MPFTSSLPTWNKTATAPTTTKQNAGWSAGEHPPASIFDWFFNTTYKALQELQAEAINTDQKGVNNGVATLDATGDIPIGQADNILNWVKGFGLGDIAKDIGSTDLNALDATGFYRGSTLTNAPGNLTGAFYIIHIKQAATYKMQMALNVTVSPAVFYYRNNNNGVWSAWTTVAAYDANGKVAIANLPAATTALAGIAQLNDTYTSTSTTQAATANALKKLTDVVQMSKLIQDSGSLLNQSTMDLNATFVTGFYYYSGGNVNHTNGPLQQNGVVEVYQYSSSTGMQVFTLMNTVTPRRWIRYCSAGVWGEWIQNAQLDTNSKVATANLPFATTTAPGIAQLNDTVSSISTVQAATANAVKTANDRAVAAETNAKNASAPIGHVGSGGAAHADVVAGGASGFMTGADKTKLNGIAAGAEVNQNAFTSVSGKTGGTLSTVVADSKSDTLTIEGQGLIQVTTDAATDTIILNTTAEANQNAFSTVQVNGTNIVSDTKTDTLFINSGTGIAFTPDAAIDSFEISLAAPTVANLTLQNGTTVYSDRTPRYIKDGYTVELDGAVIATGAGVTIATLPAGFRPLKTQIFKVAQNWSTSNDGATIYVNPDGTVVLLVAASYSQAISLCGVRFYLI